jgi:hypothetical protein
MKKLIFMLILMANTGLHAQSYELQRLILDIEKLAQLKSILKDLYKGYEILSTGYNTIKNISEGNFNLHQAFLDGLLAISPAVKDYKRVLDIIDYQGRIVSEYKAAYNRFKQDRHFNPDEIVYLGNVYNQLFNQSLKNLENLLNVLTAGKLRMSDDERLHAIDGIYAGTKDELLFLREFNNNASVLAVQRAKEGNDTEGLKRLHGIQ